MKRFIIVLLCMIITLTLTACGNSKDKQKDLESNVTKTESGTKDAGSSGTNTNVDNTYLDFKMGMTNFITDYIDTKQHAYDVLDNSTEFQSHILDAVGIYTPDLNLAEIPMYDALSMLSGDTKATGKLMLSGFDGYKEKDGAKIKFGSTHIYDSDMGMNKKGDSYTSVGYFDTDRNFMTLESKIEKDGKLLSRTVMEILKLENGNFKMQQLSCETRGSTVRMSGTFLSFNATSYMVVLAEGDMNTDFTYKSLVDSGDISVSEMAKDLKTNVIVKVENEKVSFEKK